jgi:hypothetical protein
MRAIHFNPTFDDAARREAIYSGDLIVYSPTARSRRLCDLAAELAAEAFHPLAPELAQHELPVEQYVAILAELKPRFIHHPAAKEAIRELLQELGCDPSQSYFDVPRLRTMASGDYLTAGLAYAFHPHRDTWFSAPPSQINWWLPVYPISSVNTIAFHPRYWNLPLRNTSNEYNYYRWNQESRRAAAQQIKKETRKQPQSLEPITTDDEVRLTCEAGGMILFSGAYLHSTVKNTSGRTRFSIDFRTVNLDDVLVHRGAPNIDSACTGTTLRDYLRATDFERIPEEVALRYDENAPTEGELVFDPKSQVSSSNP